jgi:flagellar motor switch protein FliM
MSEVLSPEEVDALLKGVSSGDVDSGGGFGVPSSEVTELDLTKPDWVQRDEAPPLDFLNQVLGRKLATSIRPLLKNQAEVSADPARLCSYADYVAELELPTSIHQTHSKALDSDVLFVLHADLILNYVNYYYGGDGVNEDSEPLARDFTVTERRVASQLQKKAERFMIEAWEPVVSLTFESLGNESNPEFSNFFNPADAMSASRFNITLGEKAIGWLDVLIPKTALEPHRRALIACSQGDQLQKQSRWANAFEAQVRYTEIELSSVLGNARINLGELVKLRIGDILPLELPETVELTAGSVPLFKGTFGVSNGHNAIRIVERLQGRA